MKRVGPKAKERIFKNLIAFMVEGTPLTRESRSFIYTWVRQPDGNGRSQSFYDVWDLVLQNYLPKERPILFRSCKKLSNRPIQSFTRRIYTAERFSDGHTGHLLICDTKEYLQFEDENAIEHERSFFPLCECIKKGTYCENPCFRESFYEEYKKEDEYIVRVKQTWLYDLKWNRKREDE